MNLKTTGKPLSTVFLASIHKTMEAVVIVAVFSLPALAQFAPTPSPGSGRQSQSDSGLPQFGQSGSCMPDDYGDVLADCLPIRSNTRYSNNGGYDEMSGWGGNFGVAPGSVPYRQSYENAREPVIEPLSSYPAPPTFEREPPTEFQRYVANSIGQMLPIFGAALFERVPATFAPLDRAPVNKDFAVAPGDELQITAWGQFNLSRRVVVDRTGQIVLPDAGPVSVAGMNYSQVAVALKAALSTLYKNFDLTVTLGRLHSIQIFVVGEARRPGTYTVSSLSSLVNAVFACGGPSARGSMRAIELRRGSFVVRNFDLYDLLANGDKSKDAQLESGDVILIRPAGPRVAVSGSVEHPGIYELTDESTLSEALHFADGLSALAAKQEAVLERVADGSALQALRIPMTELGLQTKLRSGDIVRILPVVRRFENTVTLRGNVADPGRFPWRAGMLLSDLIPDKQSLLTREYWKQRNGLGISGNDGADSALLQESTGASTNKAERPANSGPDETDKAHPPRVAEIAYLDQNRNMQADNSLGAATGSDSLPPLRTFVPRNTIQPPAPDINWQYALIERIDKNTLATRAIPFNLGKLVLDHDRSEDLPLVPGDVVTIFSKADFSVPDSQRSKQIRLEGEVVRAGVYTVLPGESLRSLVRRAGGLTSEAYLYGAQFTRESTRREQQKRYDDFLGQFEREVNEGASNLSSRVTSPQQAATAQTSLASQRDLIERLRKIPMNGRIVLDMSPSSKGLDAIPDLSLEDGDRLFVPARPSTVNVIGTVFEQSSFLYEEDLRVSDYLKKAGGPARSADRSHMLVVRADGSVVSKNTGVVLFANSFDGLAMHPGDSLVVPTYINRTSFVRSLMDWSQVFSNLALGAAAVNVLH